MRILVIGGTVFLGRRLIDCALWRGHSVTLFHRGQHNPDIFPEVEKIHGDRDGGLGALGTQTWDAVVDTCGYVPRVVDASASLLANRVDRYLFVSTISVYGDVRKRGLTESDPIGPPDETGAEEVTGESYGPLKVACEQVVQERLPGRALIVRPGLIVGRDDPSDRFSYWPTRIAQGGEILAPGDPHESVQFVDAADLGTWMVRMLEAATSGVFNATGPAETLTMGNLLEACVDATGRNASLTWADDAFLATQDVAPWSDLPLYIPASSEMAGFSAFDVSHAVGAGLTFRPLQDTIQDTLSWVQAERGDRPWQAGLTRERERELLAAWKSRPPRPTAPLNA